MAYIRKGQLEPKRSIWRLSILTDFFWMIWFYVREFWKTLFSLDEANAYGKPGSDRRRPGGYGGGGRGGGGPPPGTPGSGSTPKRFGDMGGIRGADHSAPCSTCR